MTGMSHMRLCAGRTIFHALRALERLGGPSGLRLAAWPGAFACALWDAPRHPYRRCVSPARNGLADSLLYNVRASVLTGRLKFHLTRVLCTLTDRLHEERWQHRCQLDGEVHLQTALAQGRPVILATAHFGGCLLLRYWLRAKGIPAATLVSERLEDRNPIKLLKDSLSPPHATPNVFSGQSPRAAVRFLKAGGILCVMLDHAQGRLFQARVPGGNWQISTTAFRLAGLTGAVVLPALIRETAPWRFVIHLARPVPDHFLCATADFSAAARHLWGEFEPVLREAPEDCLPDLIISLQTAHTPASGQPLDDTTACPNRA